MLFKKTIKWLQAIKEQRMELEKHLQDMVEKNLTDIFWLHFISSEFQLNWLRIDTLAFNNETKSFVIIEYKRDRSFSIIDQWYAYLSLMLNNKAEFVLEYQEKIQQKLSKNDVSRSETKIIFLANSFTIHQKNAINFKDLPIELWEVNKYEWDFFSFIPIKASQQTESIKTISKDETVRNVSKEIQTYTIEDHIKSDRTNTEALYKELKELLLSMDDRIEESFVKAYIWYKIGNQVAVLIKPQKSKILIEFLRVQPHNLKDPEKRVVEKPNAMKFYNKYVSSMDIKNKDDINYAIFLSKQIIDKFFV